MDENHIPSLADSVPSDSDVKLHTKNLKVTSTIDPAYMDVINSELQDWEIDVAADAFSSQIWTLGHSVKNGNLKLNVLLNDSMVPIIIN